jgi:hypothetical protein
MNINFLEYIGIYLLCSVAFVILLILLSKIWFWICDETPKNYSEDFVEEIEGGFYLLFWLFIIICLFMGIKYLFCHIFI